MKDIIIEVLKVLTLPFLMPLMPIGILLEEKQKTEILKKYKVAIWDEHDSIYFVYDQLTNIMYVIDFSYFKCELRRFEDANGTGYYLYKGNGKEKFVKYTKKEMESKTTKNKLCIGCYVYDKAA